MLTNSLSKKLVGFRLCHSSAALIGAVVLGLFLSCVPGTNAKLSADGQVLTLPANSASALALHAREYRKFNGSYPTMWPAWLILPDGTYLMKEGRIFVKQLEPSAVAYTYGYQTKIGTPAVVLESAGVARDYFARAFKSAGVPYVERGDGIQEFRLKCSMDVGQVSELSVDIRKADWNRPEACYVNIIMFSKSTSTQ